MNQSRANFDFHLLDKRHADYVAGKSNRITPIEDYVTFAGILVCATFFGVFGVSIILAVVRDSLAVGELALHNRALAILIMLGIAIFLSYLAFGVFGRGLLVDRRMVSAGRIVPGIVTDIEARQGARGYYGLQVGYQFQTPNGNTLNGKTIVVVARGSRPQIVLARGTPLAILWVDDEQHKAL